MSTPRDDSRFCAFYRYVAHAEDDNSIEEDELICDSVDDNRACERYSEENAGMAEDDMAEDDHSGESCSDDCSGIQE